MNKPWEELDKPGAAKRYRATEVKAELALNQHHYKASGGYAPVCKAVALEYFPLRSNKILYYRSESKT